MFLRLEVKVCDDVSLDDAYNGDPRRYIKDVTLSSAQ